MPFTIPTPGKLANVSHGATADLNNLYVAVKDISGINAQDSQYNGGADPTGVADSKNAIQAALDAASPGDFVYLPAGIYKTTNVLTIPTGVSLYGASRTMAYPGGNYGIGGVPITGTIIQPVGSMTAAIQFASNGSTQYGNQAIRRITIDGDLISGGTGHGILADAVAGVTLEDVSVFNCQGDGLHGAAVSGTGSHPPDFWSITRCKFSGNGGWGVSIAGMADSFITDSEATGNAGGGGWNIINCNNLRMVAGKAEFNTGGPGYLFTAQSGFGGLVHALSCTSQFNKEDGFRVTGVGTGIYNFMNCASDTDGTNGGSGGGGFAGLKVTSFSGTVVADQFVTRVTGSPASPQYGISVASSNKIIARNSVIDGATAAYNTSGTITSLDVDALGASGDSTGAKDTLNIQALLNAAPVGGVVILKPGLFRTNNELVIPPFVELRGSHGNRTDNIQVSSTIKPVNSFSGVAAIHLKDQEEGGYSTQNDGVRITSLVLDGSALSNGSGIEGIKATGLVHAVVLDRVTTQQFPSYGVGCHTYTRIDTSVQHPYSWNLWNCMGWQNKDHAFFFGNQQTDCTFLNCEALGNVGDGFYFVAAQNTQLNGCRSEFNLNGFNIQGSWGTTTASGGISLSGCTTDRNTQHGVRIESTGNGVHTIECQTRRDGRNSNSGGGGFAGIYVNACTNPVVIPYATCYPGVDDNGSGTSSPDYGVYVAGSTWVSIQGGYLHAAVAGFKDGGSNTALLRGPNIGTAVGSTSSPTRDTVNTYPGLGNIFGTGADGALVFNGSSTVAGLVPSSNIYTLTRDIHATDLTVNNGVTIKTANFRIFCRGTLSNAGTISNAGNAATGTGANPGASGGSAMLVGGRAGGNGGTGASGAGAAGTNANFGSASGAGGAGTSGTAGAAVTPAVTNTQAQNQLLQTPFTFLSGVATMFNAIVSLMWGAGGGGGGSDSSSNAGGAGGGGGGIVVIFAWKYVNTGTVTVAGGNGFTAPAGNAGGGGGGAGGLILVYTLVAWTQSGTHTVSGGSLGSGHGTGSNGQNGGTGLALNVVLAA